MLSFLLFACGPDVQIAKNEVDDDHDGFNADVDCDDSRATVNGDAEEVCDGVDNNCDGVVDTDAVDAPTWYADRDGDEHGAEDAAVAACEAPEGHVAAAGDCDDEVATTFPGADERCNGADDDCDGDVDEDAVDAAAWHRDADQDGYGDPDASTTACEAPDGHVAAAGDCDDADAAIHPDAPEADCTDPVDYNCDGSVAFADADGDGAPACEDCDDADPARSPLLVEVCDEADVDEDCDGAADGADAAGQTDWYRDRDGDAWGEGAPQAACEQPAGWSAADGDCDDYDAAVHPGGTEVCGGADEDCDGLEGDEDPSVDATTRDTWYRDADGDTFGDAARSVVVCEGPVGYVLDDSDCDDTDARTSPAGQEVCEAGDEDCDGLEGDDDGTVSDPALWYRDADGDTWGDEDRTFAACEAPSGYVDLAGDCDDGDAAVNPDAAEVCAAGDEDCDGLEGDDDGAGDGSDWYADRDADGYGAGAPVAACTAPAGYLADDQDCDDNDANVHPAAAERCAVGDEDCDGLDGDADPSVTDGTPWHRDADADGYGDPSRTTEACDPPSGWVADDTDCDDGDATASPAGAEVCGGGDEDCDGLVDDDDASVSGAFTWYRDLDSDAWGDEAHPRDACVVPAGYTALGEDCDDADAAVNPDAAEICAAGDEDCDGLEGDADPSLVTGTSWYADADTDGYGDPAADVQACSPPAGHVSNDDDCDDADATTSPAGSEVCGGGDEDCDGLTDDADPSRTGGTTTYADADGDLYGDADAATTGCNAPSGNVGDATDCDDTEVDIHPGAAEVCSDGVDDDCDGTADDGCPAEPYAGTLSVEGSGAEADSVIYGDASGDLFGEALASGVDFDADGRYELVAGASGRETFSSYTWYGYVYTIRGPVSSGAQSATTAGDGLYVRGPNTAGDTLGSRVWGLNDLDGDGFDEFAAYEAKASSDPTIWMYQGEPTSGTSWATAATSIQGSVVDAIGNAGHFDDPSGVMRVAFGDPDYNADAGILYVRESRGVSLCSYGFGVAGDQFGYAIAGGPGSDLDGDGFDDLFVSAPYDDDGATDTGSVYTFVGNSGGNCDQEGKIVGTSSSDRFGLGVVAPGDVTGDGLADLMVGAPYDDDGGSASGVVFLFDTLDPTTGTEDDAATDAYAKIVGAAASDLLGVDGFTGAMSLADVNGDGEADLLVSTAYSDPNGTSSGSAWLVYGPLSGTISLSSSSAWDARFTGDGASDRCGASSALGDLDGDGAAEIAVGCPAGDYGAYTDYGVVGIFAGH